MADPLHPIMQDTFFEGGYYQPSPLRPPVRDDASFVGEGYQHYLSPERKASGFFGDMNRGYGHAVTEYSLGGQAPAPYRQAPADQTFTYPSLYPGITRRQMSQVMDAATRDEQVPDAVADRARASAQARMAQGKSPFWNEQQDNPLGLGMRPGPTRMGR